MRKLNKTTGILLVSTGKYYQFIEQLLDSIQLNFLPDHRLNVYLFTDMPFASPDPYRMTIHNEIIERKGFPGDTLYRYHYFLSRHQRDPFPDDFLFYMDVDMRIVDRIGDDILPFEGSGLTVVMHPGFYDGGGSWESRSKSNAFVSHSRRRIYVAGGFNGGTKQAFMQMSETIAGRIDDDKSKNITAVWHDESHLNKYITEHDFKLLDCSYCYPESWSIPFKRRILALDKNHKEIRQ